MVEGVREDETREAVRVPMLVAARMRVPVVAIPDTPAAGNGRLRASRHRQVSVETPVRMAVHATTVTVALSFDCGVMHTSSPRDEPARLAACSRSSARSR